MKSFPPRQPKFILLVFLSIVAGCAPLISLFDDTAYRNAIDLKVDFSFLVESSDSTFTSYAKEVREFRKNLQKAYEYEKGRYRNELTVQQYDILLSPDGPLEGFFKVWRENQRTSMVYRKEKKELAAQIFDEILTLEKAKRREGIRLRLIDPESKQSK